MVALKQIILANSMAVCMAVNRTDRTSGRNAGDEQRPTMASASTQEKLDYLRKERIENGDPEVVPGENGCFGHTVSEPVMLHVDIHQPFPAQALGIRICKENNVILGEFSNDRQNWKRIKDSLPGVFPTNWKIHEIDGATMSTYQDIMKKLEELKTSKKDTVAVTFKPAFKQGDIIELIGVDKIRGNKKVTDNYIFNANSKTGVLDYDEPVHAKGQKFLVVNTPKGTSHPKYKDLKKRLEDAEDIGNTLKNAMIQELKEGEIGKEALQDLDAKVLATEVLDDKVNEVMQKALNKGLASVKAIKKEMEECWKYEIVHIKTMKSSFRDASRFILQYTPDELSVAPKWFIPKNCHQIKYDHSAVHYKPDSKWLSWKDLMSTFVVEKNVTPLCQHNERGEDVGKAYYDSKKDLMVEITENCIYPETIKVPSATNAMPRESAYGWATIERPE